MNIKNFTQSLDYLVKAELTPFIWGHAGIGKSSVVRQYAESKGFHFFPFYLGTQSDIGDILGLAEFVDNGDGSKSTSFAIPKWLKDTITYCNENPKSGAIIFLDEFNRARRDILNGMFSLALDKTFHTLKLPKNCHVIAAGNPPTDEYYVTDVNETALMARFVHIKLEPTFEEWIQYAEKTKIDKSLVGFIRNQPELLEEVRSNFDLPVKVDRRSVERLSRLFALDTPKPLLEELMQGIIGLERTVAYMNYMKNSETPLTGEEILTQTKLEQVIKWSDPENVLSSLLNITCENLDKHLIELNSKSLKLNDKEKANLMEFFKIIPKDISYPVISKLVTSKNALFKDFFVDPIYEKPMVDLVQTAKGTKK